MNRLRSLLARVRRFWRIRAAKADMAPLREFVYLDEVSVYSLLASRHGALPSEYTHTLTRSDTGSVGASIGLTAGLAKAGSTSRSESTVSESTQVLRKSSVQAAFKELFEGEENRLALRSPKPDQFLPRVSSWRAVESGAETATFHGWVVDADTLTRGVLVDVEVELRPSQIYKFLSIFSSMEDIVEDNRSLFPGSIYAELPKFKSISNVLHRMLIGLIPIKCRAVDYKVATVNGKELIVHRKLLDQLPNDEQPRLKDLYLTGVTEESLFWKDVRQVLFSGSRYRILARLSHSGVNSSWTPVKLVDVLSDVVPGLATQIDDLEYGIATQVGGDPALEEDSRRLSVALANFGVSLASANGQTIDPGDLPEDLAYESPEDSYASPVETRRELFDAMARAVSERLNFALDAELTARLREAAISEAGLNLDGSVKSGAPQSSAQRSAAAVAEAILDSETVAIYW